MYDAGKVIVGLGLFVVLFTSPFWYNAARGTKLVAPDLTPARAMSASCVMDTKYMRERHMDLLNSWRNDVVRLDDRFLKDDPAHSTDPQGIRRWPDGKPMQKSLTNTCLHCHSNFNEFCNRCHTDNGVQPFCFSCHLNGTEGVKVMGINKREFFKLAGLTALAAGVKPGPALAQPGPEPGAKPAGRRWAMVIDTRIDTDWAPSIAACHRVHNVPDFVTNPDASVNNPRHEIKWIWTMPYLNAFDVTPEDLEFVSERMRKIPIPLLCNHCDNPPCVRACPTQATFKRPDGIVVMDFHRCIGCRFCMAACPYGSRSFNLKDPRLAFKDPKSPTGWTPPNPAFPTRMKGVVEKCNFCSERIELGLQPACVEACTSGAMTFGDLNERGQALPGGVAYLLANNYAIKRKPELGTLPMVYYLV